MQLSVIIPVHDEEESLQELHERLSRTCREQRWPYELIFVDDASRDRSPAILAELARDPHTKVVSLPRNRGQHEAILAGLELARGDAIVTIDADLQNPPEEIPRLLAEIDAGHDVVGSYRRTRRDHPLRRWASRATNALMRRVLGLPFRDLGCMLRAYRREVAEEMRLCAGRAPFIPALALGIARNPTEIEVDHQPRRAGESKYPLRKLLKLWLDLVIGSTFLPLRLCALLGFTIAGAGLGFSTFLLVRRLLVGPEVEGTFTLFAILFFFIGLLFVAVGVLGEYLGRTYAEVRGLQRFLARGLRAPQRRTRPAVPRAFVEASRE